MLLSHDKDETIVPYERSALMNDALHGAGKSVGMMTLPHDDHWLSPRQTRLQMLEESVCLPRGRNRFGLIA